MTLENLYHANENTSLTRLYFLDDSKTIGYRWGNQSPKDLVLLSRSRLMIDSLHLGKQYNSWLIVHSIFQESPTELLVIHSSGTNVVKIAESSFLLNPNLPNSGLPPIASDFIDGHELIPLGKFTIGYKVNPKKWLTSPDYWVYDWEKERFAIYEDSKFPEQSNNRYWKIGSGLDPEPFSTYNHFTYFISKTQEGFLFNLPLKNRFVIHNAKMGTMQSYSFPVLSKKGDAWFVLYDRHWNRFFPVLQQRKNYKIYALDQELNTYQLLATSTEQPLEVNKGSVYIRKFLYKEKKKGWYFDHHLIDLYPKLN